MTGFVARSLIIRFAHKQNRGLSTQETSEAGNVEENEKDSTSTLGALKRQVKK
ncbi:MAG: hypothetical protein PSN37_02210 [Alphaproteobacteria bacterium]|nr:hypothetical protein [Alphaproteobacteria bacterium]